MLKLINKLKTMFKKEDKPMVAFHKGVGNRYTIGGGWGDRVQWFPNYESMSVCGWKQPRPEKGDWLLCGMKSGKTGVFRFTKVDYCSDPPDMFFAAVEQCGYMEDTVER